MIWEEWIKPASIAEPNFGWVRKNEIAPYHLLDLLYAVQVAKFAYLRCLILLELFTFSSSDAIYFCKNIRAYNSLLACSSFGANIDEIRRIKF